LYGRVLQAGGPIVDISKELLLAAAISLPGFVLPVGALALNRMRRRPAWRPLARVLAFFFLLYALNVSYLVVWAVWWARRSGPCLPSWRA
jgi:hypothetical protein